jgi:phosphate transport system substrate-binding protein
MKKITAFFVLFYCGNIVFSQTSIENEPVEVAHDVNIRNYIPFGDGSKAVWLDTTSKLKLHENLPKLDGATALYPVYASFVQAVYPLSDYNIYWNNKSIVKCTQTPQAYENLINGDADIIFCAEPSKDQIAKAAENEIIFNMIPVGIDAFVFFVNKNNPLNNITSEQVWAVYSGEITNWLSINGIDEPIIAYQRPENSGSQTILESVIMANKIIMEPLKENVVGGMGGIIEQVAVYKNYANAIGYSFLFFATEMVQNDQIKLLSVDGIYPSKETIQTGEYPFIGPFYAITRGDETENMNKLIEWILSEQGQYLVERTGYIPLK